MYFSQSTAIKCIAILTSLAVSNIYAMPLTTQTTQKSLPNKQQNNTQSLLGSYVSDGYNKRTQGYDWVGVSISPETNTQIRINVRSRADKKKPTCTFDAVAKSISPNIYQASVDGKDILFTFSQNKLNISAKNSEDRNILYYFCSGGASLEDTYSKIKGDLDNKQVDPRVFQKNLKWNQISFDVSSTGKGSIQTLTIQPYGLKSNQKLVHKIDGKIMDAEIGDINTDGHPELFIYTQSAGSGSYGNVVAYSLTPREVMTLIPFPSIAKHAQAGKGYMGHDEFAVVENTFAQRFPIYRPTDTNSKATGGIRQIQYKLGSKKNKPQFIIDKIVEY